MRLDRWLADKVPQIGRRRAKQWCESGKVTVNGRAAEKSLRLTTDMQISYEPPAERRAVQNPALSLDVRLETALLVVVHKPAGQATAPLDGEDGSALANGLLARYPETQMLGNALEAGLLHRLDNGTSGLLVAARNQAVYTTLRQALRQGQLKKEYLAIAHDGGLAEIGTIDLALRPSRHNARRMVVAHAGQRGARRALTHYAVVERHANWVVAHITAGPALRHQIRAHFAALDCPLVNDELYGAPRFEGLAAGRHALHARRIVWEGNEVVPPFDCLAPLTDDLTRLLRELGFRTSCP